MHYCLNKYVFSLFFVSFLLADSIYYICRERRENLNI